jgi:hypothetical protein
MQVNIDGNSLRRQVRREYINELDVATAPFLQRKPFKTLLCMQFQSFRPLLSLGDGAPV